MTQTPDLSPNAQAILRAIENEAQARRETTSRSNEPGAYTPPTSPVPPMPGPAQPHFRDVPAPTGPEAVADPLGAATDRLMRLVDHVVAQTEGVRARVKEVEHSLDQLSTEIAQTTALKAAGPVTLKPELVIVPPPPDLEDDLPLASAPAPVTPAPVTPAPVAPVGNASDGARLMAIELAVSGSSRGEVGQRLVDDFGVADPNHFLDDVFGPGSGDNTRMPWTG